MKVKYDKLLNKEREADISSAGGWQVDSIWAWTWISISSVNPSVPVITNTAPDKVVAITDSWIANVTWTYPNFNVDVPATDISGKLDKSWDTMSGDLDMWENHIINMWAIQFDVDTPWIWLYSKGKIYRDTTYNTLSLDLWDWVSLQLWQESHIRVVNKTGSLISNGDVVYINWIDSEKPTIAKAQGNSITTSHIIWIATQDIIDDWEWFITAFGSVSDLNTSMYALWAPLYLSAAVAWWLTDVAPSTPNISIQLWIVEKVWTTDWRIFIDIWVPITTDVTLSCGCDWVSPSVNAVKTYVDQRRIDVNRYGFVPWQTNLTFDWTNTVTVTPISSTRSYYRAWLKYTITWAKSIVIPWSPLATWKYYIYIDAIDWTLSQSNSTWTLNDTKLPVATLAFNNSLTPKFEFTDERHTCLIDRRQHMKEHYTEGTQFSSWWWLTWYTLNTATDAGNTFWIDAANIFDEDLYKTLTALTDTNWTTANYKIFYRTAASTWVWLQNAMPFLYTWAGAPYWYIQYDNAWTMTDSANNRRVNYYVYMTNIVAWTEATQWTSTQSGRFAIIPWRWSFTSPDLAYAENPWTFTFTWFPVDEAVAVWQITFNTSWVANTVKWRCRIDRVQRVTSNIISSATSVSATHDWLSWVNLAQAWITYWHIDDQAQTIAWVKTFSSDVIVPAETYWPDWNWSNEVPTKNDVYDEMETKQDVMSKATWAEVDTWTDDAKFVTAKAIEDSSYIKSWVALPLSWWTMTWVITLAENAAIAHDPVLSADWKYTWLTITWTAWATLAFGDLIYLDPTDSRRELVDANAAAWADWDARWLVWICVLAASWDGQATNILLNWVVRADTAFPTLTINAPIYASETAWDVVVTQPTTTDVVIRVLWFWLTADSMYFNPSNDFITHT